MKRLLMAGMLTLVSAYPVCAQGVVPTPAAAAPVAVPAATQAAAVAAPADARMTATVTKSRELRKQRKPLSEQQRKRLFARDHLTASALIPFKIVAVSTAAAVGTPIAIARCEARRMDIYTTAVNDELSAPDGSLPLVVSSVPGQSLRAIGTVGEGVVNGLFNASEGWEQPFSKRSFSLKTMYPID